MRTFLAAVLLLPAASVAGRVLQDEMCSNGMAGIESDVSFGDDPVCCPAECGFCGGSGCGTNAPEGLSAADCCAGAVLDTGVSCDEVEGPPCIVTGVETEEMVDESEESDSEDLLAGIDTDSLFAEIVELHNEIRCIHDTAPLVLVDDPILNDIDFPFSCNDVRNVFDGGDVLISDTSCSPDNENGCDTLEVLEWWYDVQTQAGGRSTYGDEAQQILWSEATEIGCRLDTCFPFGGIGDSVFLACRYNARVRPMEILDFIGLSVNTAEECDYPGTAAVVTEGDDDFPGPAPTPNGDGIEEAPTDFFQEILDLNNEARCIHDAPPLLWSPTLQEAAENRIFGSTCTNVQSGLTGSNEENVNVFICSVDGCEPQDVIERWFFEAAGAGLPTAFLPSALNLLWLPTTEIGCVLDTCRDFNTPQIFVFVACLYNPGNNNAFEILENVNVATNTLEECEI